MVAIVENWAIVTGRVTGVRMAAGYPDFCAVDLDIEGVSDVEGYPNLLHADPGSRLTVLVRRDVVRRERMTPGDRVSVRMRRGGKDGIFAHPKEVAMLKRGAQDR